MRLILSFLIALASANAADVLSIVDINSLNVARTVSFKASNISGAASVVVYYAPSSADVDDLTKRHTCSLPCDALWDTTVTMFARHAYLDGSGNIIVQSPIEQL